MKRSIVSGLTACLLAAGGCAGLEDQGNHEPLPGDIDDADPSTGGKGDAWDSTNDPRRLSQQLNYRIAELPLEGKLDKPVWSDRTQPLPEDVPLWADTYWPTAQGSTNARWQGRTVKSPLEKYDAVFNGAPGCEAQPASHCGAEAKTQWDEYLTCAGPAAKWHTMNFQGASQMYDGVDSDDDGEVDECGDNDGVEGWWGLCHAWSPAAILEPEPLRPVTYQGVEFTVADIKALIVTVYDSTDALMLGGRCNSKEMERDEDGRVKDKSCQDVNPGAWHVVVTNFLGINDMALVEDRTAGIQVWNQPMFGYKITKQDKVDATRAMECIGATGEAYKFNDNAVDLYEVKMTTDYLVEGSASRDRLGMDRYIRHDNLQYILEVDSRGKIIGGEYCKASQTSHADFLWAPLRVSSSSYRRNSYVNLEKVRTLINLSRQPETPIEPATGADKSYENLTATAIPDNDPTGVTLEVAIEDSATVTGASVTVEIAHTWRGDLRVELLSAGRSVKVLHDKTGGSADDLNETYTLSSDELGTTEMRGSWSLKVSDHAGQDVGTVEAFKLTFHTQR